MERIKLFSRQRIRTILGKYKFKWFNKTDIKKFDNNKRENREIIKRWDNRSNSRPRNNNKWNRTKWR